jgi:hypothetical protein
MAPRCSLSVPPTAAVRDRLTEMSASGADGVEPV